MTKQEEIKQLKLEKDAVLLAHYYVPAEVQEIADYVGDSFYLSKVASKLTNKVLVFCGVSFMGESGKLLNPDKAMRTLQLYAISTRLLKSNHGQMYASPQRMQCRL